MKSVTGEELSFKKARIRWSAFFTVMVVAMVSALCAVIFGLSLRSENRSALDSLNRIADRIETRIGRTPVIALERVLRIYAGNPDIFTSEDDFIEFLTLSGESILQLGGTLVSNIEAAEGFTKATVLDYSNEQREYRILTRLVRGVAAQPIIFLRVGRSIEILSDRMRSLLWSLIMLVALAAALSWTVGMTLAGYVLSPLKDSYQKLQRFTADASHELKTPLSIMRLALDMLKAKELPQDVLDKIRMIDTATSQMQALTSQLITMARVRNFKREEQIKSTINVRSLLEEVSEKLSPLSLKKGIRVHVECDEDLTVLSMPDLLSTAIGNLLDNAIKFSNEKSEVILRAIAEGDSMCIQVIDSGPGVKTSEREKIFERFYKSETSNNDSGSGMGLAIAREFIGLLGGEITVSSEIGKGSVFETKLRRK